MNNLHRALAISAKLAVSATLIWYAFGKVDAASAFKLLRSVHPGVIAAALGILALQQFAAGLRFHRLLKLVHAPIAVAAAVDAVFVGVFFSQTFISFIGGDAMRIWRVVSLRVPFASAFKAVLFDRVSGFAALIGMILMSLPILFRITTDSTMRLSILVMVLIGILGTVVFLFMDRLPIDFRRWRVLRTVCDISSFARSISTRLAEISYLLGISLFIHALNVIVILVIALGLGVKAHFVEFLVLVPPVLLLAMLPISFAGWGVREGVMAAALGLVGVGAEQSIAASIGFGFCLIVVGLPGGLIWLIVRPGAGAAQEIESLDSPEQRFK